MLPGPFPSWSLAISAVKLQVRISYWEGQNEVPGYFFNLKRFASCSSGVARRQKVNCYFLQVNDSQLSFSFSPGEYCVPFPCVNSGQSFLRNGGVGGTLRLTQLKS